MFKFVFAVALLSVSFPSHLVAQQLKQEGGVIVLESSDGINLSDAFGGEVVLRFSAPQILGYRGTYSKLNNPQVKRELELVERQQQQLRDLQTSFAKKIGEIRNAPAQGSPQHDKRARQRAIKDAREGHEKKIEEILVPHQLERLKQVSLQLKMRQSGYMETLTNQELADLLGIGDEQKERIKKRAAELRAEMDEEIAQLKKKARKKLLGELTSDQRKQLEELLGSEFDDKPVDRLKRVEDSKNSTTVNKD